MRGAAMTMLVVAAFAWSCSRGNRDATAQQPPPVNDASVEDNGPLRLTVGVTPRASVTVAELPKVSFQFVVENVGKTTVDPHLGSSVLLVNGKPARDWDITINNGPRDHRWSALPAGDRLELTYQMAPFDAPGEYTVVLRAGRAASPPLIVRVLEK